MTSSRGGTIVDTTPERVVVLGDGVDIVCITRGGNAETPTFAVKFQLRLPAKYP